MLTPSEYIRGACQLHLQIADISDDVSKEAVAKFLQQDDATIAPRLFVWIPHSSPDTLLASTESFEGKNLGAIVFINTSTRNIQTISQIQVLTMSPRRQQEEKVSDAEDEEDQVDNSNSEALLMLQLYARHFFTPTIEAIDHLSEEKETSSSKDSQVTNMLQLKIRELDLTLSQCRQFTMHSIPHVSLQTHPVLQAIPLTSSSKISLEDLNLTSYLSNDEFLNEVQSKVNSWISLIRKVTTLPTSHVFSETDLEEVTYWANLHRALAHIREELSKPSTVLTLTLLKSAKRFVTTIALENNTGLDKAEGIVQDIYSFVKGYPAQQLASAGDWDGIMNAMEAIFDHLPKVRQSRYYDFKVVKLLEASTVTLKNRIDFTLRNKFKSNGIMLVDYNAYEKDVYGPTQDIFVRFDVLYAQFVEFILDFGRRTRAARGGDKTPAQIVEEIVLSHLPLKQRLEDIQAFRSQHEKLRLVVSEVLTGVDDHGNSGSFIASEAIKAVEEAPVAVFASIDVLDLTAKGQVSFDSAIDSYERKIDAIEEKMATLLRDKLTSCRDAEDMFAVFARFNPLLTRTRVHNAVKEFQIHLISTVSEAIEKLQSKFTHKYETSPAASIARVRGIPPVSGKILWARQIERQVHALMKRMGDVLGPNWGQHLEGRQLRRSGDELLSKLDAKAFFRSWVSDWEREMGIDATSANTRLNSYPIVIKTENLIPAAHVNFDEKYEALIREIRHLKWLGFERDIPRTLTQTANEYSERYPVAMALKGALRSYHVARTLITADIEPLIESSLRSIRDTIAEAFGVTLEGGSSRSSIRIKWDSKELIQWVMSLSELVTNFEERVETLLQACDKIETEISNLSKVSYDHNNFSSILDNIQKIIDKLSLAGFSNLSSWVESVNTRVGFVLKDRLEYAIKSWINTFTKKEEIDDDLVQDKKEKNDFLHSVEIPMIHVELFLKNQEISATPSAPEIRSLFLDRFHDYVSIVCSLPRASSGRFEVFGSSTTNKDDIRSTYDDLLNQVATNFIAKAYDCIEVYMCDVSKFVNDWFSYQTLWDTRVFEVADALGDNMELWHSVLLEASVARNALDASQVSASFGPIIIKFDKVQSQINLKYDSWQKELQSRYAEVLGQRIVVLHECIESTKSSLEGIGLDTSAATETVVTGVTLVQDTKRQCHMWRAQVEELVSAEKFLKRQRHTFQTGWVQASRLEGQFSHLEQILTKRNRSIEEQLPILQTRVNMEDKIVCSRVQDLLVKWTNEKPLRGSIAPTEALELISQFEAQMKKTKTDEENLIKAKDALCMEVSIGNQDITIALEEISDLKEVWTAISTPHEALNKIKETSWSSAVTRDIRKQLEDIQRTMRTMSNKIRQFDAFTYLNDIIKGYLTGHIVLSELKTDALKDRHWSTLLDRFGIKVQLSELTVGLLWDHGILQRRKDINEILSIAQGEMALEVFLSQVKDRWTKQELQMVLYQNRIRLIKGWDNLFAGLDDHIGGLALMKSSPYYRSVSEFQEEGKLWDERLTKLRSTFDSWVEVQRRWVYLEGIFFGSSDIKAQLSAEWARFRNVDGEFVSLMRRISSRPFAMEVLNIENLQRTLDRLENLMIGIQRALGDYLAKQRNDFSRFYFLGDDDLLEIIGNCGEPGKVLAHLGKMFAGIASLRCVTTDLNDDIVVKFDAMISKDGEVVPLIDVIQVTSKESPKVWLKKLEDGMHNTLAQLLFDAVQESSSLMILNDDKSNIAFVSWAKKFPAQVMILATLVNWSMSIDASLREDGDSSASLQTVLLTVESKLDIMAKCVLTDLPADIRKKFEQLITELVHQRDVTQSLINGSVNDVNDFRWLYHLRYKYNPNAELLTEKLQISLSNATFFYGFEYLGIGDRLVQTPLTDKAYLTLTQALHFRLGGNPFGPAGTGKTETVKALGAQLGRFVVVMNCDEAFDFSAMGRIFCGLCQVGAWGCFDEFNRLEERILSAVSQQILTIQKGLISRQESIELLGKSVNLHNNVGIFVTMNPGYAGRSNLPDNLKSLFRSVAMVKPDSGLIAQVMLYSQGIISAQSLSSKIVKLFDLCQSQMSCQSHYDFSLRALKTLVISAGALKRQIMETNEDITSLGVNIVENDVMVQIACNNILPKLVADDLDIFPSILAEVFPGSKVTDMKDDILRQAIESTCEKMSYVLDDKWTQKILQLKEVLEMRHGVMLVGQSGSGKSAALHVLIRSLEQVDGKKNEIYTIDPKAIDKHSLYGILDATTMEWTDGVFTSILRMILANQKGEADKRHYIVFDGDVDPEWAENLNSVLDDNKLLTLPSGERLEIPPNVRIVIEVDSLAQATPATVSRCGMVWFSEGTVSLEMSVNNLYSTLLKQDVSGIGIEITSAQSSFLESIQSLIVPQIQDSPSLVMEAVNFAIDQDHIMKPTRERFLVSLKALLVQGISQVITYNEMHPDFPMTGEHLDLFSKRWLLHSLLWSFSGSTTWSGRTDFSNFLIQKSGLTLPVPGANISDYKVRVQDGEYELWSDSVPRMEIESHQVTSSDIVITTTDTVRHSDILEAWISSRMPVILTGPPGSGKTMTLTSVLQSLQGIVIANLNFSSKTTPELILKTFRQYCSYIRKGKDLVLEPSESLGSNTWLVVFCDEINLPENDLYGTQKVIMFMRQLVEQGGFWREDNSWVKINRIQFVGACNPPTDAGRVVMSSRFLRHAPLLLVDFPARDSLMQIYGTFNGGMMKLFPNLKGETDALTNAMVQLYCDAQTQFTPDLQPQYFYSPRELSRWIRGVYEAIVDMDSLTRDELVRIWAHEAQRLFCDRLVEEDERKWCENRIDLIAEENFAGVDHTKVLARPLFYSGWMSKDTRRVEREELKRFLSARLSVFYEEELDVPLVIFDEVLDHILRIDRVLRQPMGHCLLVGDSGTGKTVLSKFVSWMNGLSIFQIKAHSRYDLEDFNEDLRSIMRRVGIDGEKICFIFDESNALGSGFLEAMNALLASGEVPGLFDGDEYTSLINSFRDTCSRNGLIIDSEEELWRRFTSIVQRNLHVVFTMNPSGGEWKNRSTTSPALFNRCVVDWFGTWSSKAMGEVGKEFTSKLDFSDAESVGGSWGIGDGQIIMDKVSEAFEVSISGGIHQAVVAALVEIHDTVKQIADECAESSSTVTRTYLSPRDFLALIHNFIACTNRIREQVEDEQLHVNAGLHKLRQTQENVSELRVTLSAKTEELRRKEGLANEKLQQMVTDQQKAEKRKEEVEKTSREVEKQSFEIVKRKEEAQKELDEAEPALLSAKSAVEGIKKTDLDFVRNLPRPTINVQLTLECVAILLGESNLDWSNVRKMLGRIDFISNILNFNASDVTPRQIKILQEKYFEGNDDLNYEVVMRASKACGPLYRWAESQIKYSLVYNRVQPLREEVEKLEIDAESAVAHQHVLEEEITQLEKSIDDYKHDYALLIRDVESLKREMELVTEKVARAESLILSLRKESERWSKSSEGFQVILRNLVGDGLLMAAFLTYSGFFDFRARVQLSKRWQRVLDLLGIEYRDTLSMVDILSKHSDRIHWQSLGLPSDNLSLENGVILENFLRFPLIIDPSGHAIDFVMNKFKNEKIQKTSFLDNAFTKTLAGAIRFGTTLLVENVEHIDPILNPVLNKEIQKTGGRSLIRIGTEEVDYSPNFKIILTTKNPAAKLSPDICSRVTLVNFTVTPASLQSQSLSLVLRKKKPKVEEERISVSKLQGEQLVRLRELEEKMLATLSAAEGSILDDDRVVKGMEFLMKEGNEIEKQIANSSNVIKEVERVMNQFEPFANLCRDIFILLLSMRELSFLYEFSSESFMQIIASALSHGSTSSISDTERMSVLRQNLFVEVAARIGRSLTSTDKMVFALLLTNLIGTDIVLPEGNRTVEDISDFIQKVFGTDFPWQGRGLDNMHDVLGNEIDCAHPLLVCSAPGHDISDRVDVLADDMKKELFSIAMGSSEGFITAERYIMTASKNGSWVLLRNCHLCTDWLQDTLVKKLQGLSSSCHPDFRLIITSEMNPHLPTSLLRMSDVIVAEAPSGVKASLTRFMSSLSADRLGNPIRNRLYLLLGWINAVIQERLLYVPTGWLEAYEFTESDAIHAVSVIDSHIDLAFVGKHTIDPEKLPWDAFQTSLSKDIFGGRITKDRDQQILNQLISSLFVPSCFDINFKLADVDGAPCLPDGTSRSECFAWVQSLPSYTPPTWIGLDVSDETLRSKAIVETVVGRVSKIQNIIDLQ